jgi:membrane protease YdiL (CAAX protease family)
VEENEAALSLGDQPSDAAVFTPLPAPPRWLAALQVILVCGIPTQIFAAAVLVFGAKMPLDPNDISLEFIATVSFVDTAIVAILIRLFLSSSGERSSDVFIGSRSVRGEVLRGVLLLPVVFLGVTAVVLTIRTIAPWMHNVEKSPFEAFVNSPLDAAIFLVVVVLAGGVREELQRAFILHRFEQRLGGIKLGLVLFTLAFGAFHLDQGLDIALAISLLGFFWGVTYIKRRSAILPMANHASFNATQVFQIVLVKSFGA